MVPKKPAFEYNKAMFGKILGFIIGRSLTRSTIGGIVGAIAGHFFIDSRSTRNKGGGFRSFTVGSTSMFQRQDLFFQLFFSLLGKMAQEDGTVSSEEEDFIASLLNKMNLYGAGRTQAMQYFSEAKSNPQSYQEIAQAFAQATANQPQLKSQLLYQLVGLASADRVVTKEERKFLEQAASIFSVSTSQLEHMLESFGASDDKSYHILGLTKHASNEEIKKAYKALLKEYHPDILKSKGLPPSMLKFAEQRFHDIQKAWQQIQIERKMPA